MRVFVLLSTAAAAAAYRVSSHGGSRSAVGHLDSRRARLPRLDDLSAEEKRIKAEKLRLQAQLAEVEARELSLQSGLPLLPISLRLLHCCGNTPVDFFLQKCGATPHAYKRLGVIVLAHACERFEIIVPTHADRPADRHVPRCGMRMLRRDRHVKVQLCPFILHRLVGHGHCSERKSKR